MEQDWRRKAAIEIVGRLPEDPEDARIVLKLARKIVDEFLVEQPRQQPRQACVVPFRVKDLA